MALIILEKVMVFFVVVRLIYRGIERVKTCNWLKKS